MNDDVCLEIKVTTIPTPFSDAEEEVLETEPIALSPEKPSQQQGNTYTRAICDPLSRDSEPENEARQTEPNTTTNNSSLTDTQQNSPSFRSQTSSLTSPGQLRPAINHEASTPPARQNAPVAEEHNANASSTLENQVNERSNSVDKDDEIRRLQQEIENLKQRSQGAIPQSITQEDVETITTTTLTHNTTTSDERGTRDFYREGTQKKNMKDKVDKFVTEHVFGYCKFPVGEDEEMEAIITGIDRKKIAIFPGANKLVIAEMFHKYIPLRQRELRNKIAGLAKSRFESELMSLRRHSFGILILFLTTNFHFLVTATQGTLYGEKFLLV